MRKFAIALALIGGLSSAHAAEVDTITVLDSDSVEREVPTLLSVEAFIDGLEALLGTIDADTGSMLTALQLLDNAIAGNELQVDVLTLPALIAGTANIGDVDVVSSTLPTGAATAAKQPALGTAGSSSTDVISVQGIASGTALPVSVATVPTHAVTQSGTWTVQPGNTANTTAWKVDGSAVTQPVSGAVTLGAGTAAYGKLSANSGVDIGDVDVTSLPATAPTAAKQDTGNTSLSAIDTDTSTIATATTDTETAVDGLETLVGTTNTTLTTMDGRAATIATATTDTETAVDGLEALAGTINTATTDTETAVDGLEALVGTTNTNTGASATALAIIDNIVAGNEAQVDIVSGGPAQYTEGDTDATPTGSAIEWRDASDVMHGASEEFPLPVTSPEIVSIDAKTPALTLGGAVPVEPVDPLGNPFNYDAPAAWDIINITMSGSSQEVIPVRTPGSNTRHGLELQLVGTGTAYCRWGTSAATVALGGHNFQMNPGMPAWTIPFMMNGPPQTELNCIGSTGIAASLIGTEYHQ